MLWFGSRQANTHRLLRDEHQSRGACGAGFCFCLVLAVLCIGALAFFYGRAHVDEQLAPDLTPKLHQLEAELAQSQLRQREAQAAQQQLVRRNGELLAQVKRLKTELEFQRQHNESP